MRTEFAGDRAKLQRLVLDESGPRKARMHALWALIGTGSLEADFHLKLLAHPDAGFRAWGVRAAGNSRKVDPAIRAKVAALANDPSPDVQLQVAIAARKIEGVDALPVLVRVLCECGDDKLIPPIVWQNLHPLLEDRGEQFLRLLAKADARDTRRFGLLLPRVIERLLAARKPNLPAICELVALLGEGPNADADCCCKCLGLLSTKVQTGEITGKQREVAGRPDRTDLDENPDR